MAESGRVLLEFLISHYIRLVRAFESVEDWSKFALLTEEKRTKPSTCIELLL